MMKNNELKVGLFLFSGALIIGLLSLKISDGFGLFQSEKQYWFYLEDANGLVPNSRVKTSGIAVGVISRILLVEGRAKVVISVDENVPVTKNSYIEVRTDGILGDRHIEVAWKKGEDLPEGSEIKEVMAVGSMNDVFEKIGSLAGSLSEIGDVLLKSVKGDGDKDSPIGRALLNLEKFSGDLASFTGKNKNNLEDLVVSWKEISNKLKGLLTVVDSTELKKAFDGAVSSLESISGSLGNVEEITDKINSGDGTFAKLINDGDTVDKINSTLDHVSSFLGGAQKMQTTLDFHSEYLLNFEKPRSYLGVKVQPGADRYYEVQVVNGKIVETAEGEEEEDSVKFTATFAKRFYNFTLKGGVIESEAGLGLDYRAFNEKLNLSFQAYNFEDVSWKSSVRYNFLKSFYVTAGRNHFSQGDEDALSSNFVGLGFFLSNNDLLFLASRIGL